MFSTFMFIGNENNISDKYGCSGHCFHYRCVQGFKPIVFVTEMYECLKTVCSATLLSSPMNINVQSRVTDKHECS